MLAQIERIKNEGLNVKLVVIFKLKKIFLYFIKGELIDVEIVPNFGEIVKGKKALRMILKMNKNFRKIEILKLSSKEIFKLSPLSIENKNPSIEDMKTFFFYITPEQIRILTYLVFKKSHAYIEEVEGYNYEYEIFDMWENGIIEFYGFTIAISNATKHILLRLLKEKLREIVHGHEKVDEEFLKEQGFAIFKDGEIRIPKEYKEVLKEEKEEKMDKKKLLLKKYKIEEPSREEIKKLLLSSE